MTHIARRGAYGGKGQACGAGRVQGGVSDRHASEEPRFAAPAVGSYAYHWRVYTATHAS